MGNCVSAEDRKAQLRSQEIDKQIEEDSRRLKKECKVLLLGSDGPGKSTCIKQMKIIQQNGYTLDERMAYRHTIYRNLLDSAQLVIAAMRKFGMDCEDPANQARLEKILDYSVDPASTFYFAEDVAQAIFDLWKDPIMPILIDHSNEHYLMDSAG